MTVRRVASFLGVWAPVAVCLPLLWWHEFWHVFVRSYGNGALLAPAALILVSLLAAFGRYRAVPELFSFGILTCLVWQGVMLFASFQPINPESLPDVVRKNATLLELYQTRETLEIPDNAITASGVIYLLLALVQTGLLLGVREGVDRPTRQVTGFGEGQ